MEQVVVKLFIALFNGLGALLPQLPGFIDRIRATGELTADGTYLLEQQEKLLLERKRRAEEIAAHPLPVPPPKPTRPG